MLDKTLRLLVLLGLAACGPSVAPSHPPNAPPPDPNAPPTTRWELGLAQLPTEVVRDAHLVSYPSCHSLEAAMKARLIRTMRTILNSNLQSALINFRSGWYRYGGTGGWSGGGMDAGSWGGVGGAGGGTSAGGSGGAGGGSGGTGPTDVSQTNVQVADVDEPDIMKNDGTRIFVLSKGKLIASRSWPAAELSVRGSLAIPGSATEMFLDGDLVVVFSLRWSSNTLGTYSSATLATLVDVGDLANLKVVGQYELPGSYRSARRIGRSVRVVVSRNFAWPAGVSTWVDLWSQSFRDEAEVVATFAKLALENEHRINTIPLDQLLLPARWHGAKEVAFNPQCDAVLLGTGVTHLGFSEVATFQLDVPAQLHRQLIGEAANEVYADDDSLYFTSRHWWWNALPGAIDSTYLHKLDTSDPTAAKYVASGVVDGNLVDQFSIDEWKGNLRLATTVTVRNGGWSTWNEVTVLGQAGSRLVQLGKSARLAAGERITSARFMGAVGYAVTFRQVDPLFVFNLEDPTHPIKVGELKVPGFSSYIHPLDATHLLTIGTYLPESGVGTRAVQLAIFDVSDLTAPKQTHLQLLGSYGASSEAQWQHKAFNYFAAKKLLAVPFYEWTSAYDPVTYRHWYEVKSELRVFEVDPALGFTARGSLSLSDLQPRSYSWYSSGSMVRRSVMADDFVYAVSEAGIRVAHVDALQTPLATAKF